MTSRRICYNIAVDGVWIGSYKHIEGLGQQIYAVKCYVKQGNALKRAKEILKKTKGRKVIEVFKSWGSYPEQRELLTTFGNKDKA